MRALRAVGWSAGAIVAVVLLLILGVYGFSARDFNRTYALDVTPLRMTVAESSVDVGAHIARVRGCVDCHGEDGSGREFINDPAVGVLWASNLTSGEGGIAGYGEADWDRAVRHGVNLEGKPLIFMPSQEFWSLSDEDLAALIAYYRSLPSVDAVRPGPRVGPLGRALHLAGQLPLVSARLVDHLAERPEAPPVGASAEYGAYLATGCTGCHGEGFSGGRIPGGDPGWPPASNLTPDPGTGIGSWSLADLSTALREGVRPDGSMLDPAMPIAATRHLTDTELEALYAFLMSLDPVPFGDR